MRLKELELNGFKSFAKKTSFLFDSDVTAIVGPNGSGKSNVAESFRWVLGEQSLKSLRGKRGEDLIFNGSSNTGRLNRAAAKVVFDNADRRLGLDFDEVTIEREVFRDGTNEYALNGSKVRLKDILELLAGVSLGSMGHHIISQGEADKILNSSILERRSIIEEALGLKAYQWKIGESERKLLKTEDNIKEAESLRREIAPHIKFLKKQVEKIEKADELRRELKALYAEYLKKEDLYLNKFRQGLAERKHGPEEELRGVEEKLSLANAALSSTGTESDKNRELSQIETNLRNIRYKKDELARGLGRLEGMIEIKSERVLYPKEEARLIGFSEVEKLIANIDQFLANAEREEEVGSIKEILGRIKGLLGSFTAENHMGAKPNDDLVAEINKMKEEKAEMDAEVGRMDTEESCLRASFEEIKRELEKEKEATRGAEREVFELRSRRSELRSILESLRAQEEKLHVEEEDFKREISEGVTLVDREVMSYQSYIIEGYYVPEEDRAGQEDRRRKIERIKIRLEDMGMEGTDVMEEFKQVTERDEFLARELEDLYKSKDSLRQLIKELKEKIDIEFRDGIIKINKEFQTFFELMFGGGNASLEVLVPEKKKIDTDLEMPSDEMPDEEPAEKEGGIEVNVSLPRKKIRGLQMLSGGERTLTSIALLFAMSQVNPPPFLILDETDAALDEANSRKYGDIIEKLSHSSQLIVITHNRETMSRAGIIYGVTMGSDSISRLLSIKFDEAANFAK